MKYMVMECHLSYAVVLAEDGRFLKVANLNYEVGQTVADVLEMQIPQPLTKATKKKIPPWLYSLTAMAACLVLVAAGAFQFAWTPYGSVYMSINPEVRIDVNRKDAVVGLEAMNADGKALIANYGYKKKDLDLVMEELVDLAIDLGYLHEGGQIILTVDAEDDEWVVNKSDDISAHLQEHLTKKLTVIIEVTNINSGKREVIIPVIPAGEADNDYGASDYGDAVDPNGAGGNAPASTGMTNYDDTDYGPDSDGVTNYDDTDYGPDSDGVTNYDDTDYGPDSDGVTNYDDTDYGPDSDGVTNYDDTDYGPDSDGITNYDFTNPDETDDGPSDYNQAPQGDDGQTDYEAPAVLSPDDGQSEYGPEDTNELTHQGQSAYEETSDQDSNQGQSDYLSNGYEI